jgi:phosphoribosylformylglycinamidine synthase
MSGKQQKDYSSASFVYHFRGRASLSEFRCNQLIEQIKKSAGNEGCLGLMVANVYLLLSKERELSPEERILCCELLDAAEESSEGYFIMPRRGTTSPWSSKATEILNQCGLKSVVRVEQGQLVSFQGVQDPAAALQLLFDRMVQGVYQDLEGYFEPQDPSPLKVIDILNEGVSALDRANAEMGLALSAEEIQYLFQGFKAANRNPSDAELVMFGQVNSEHCRHKVFNASWVVDGQQQSESLFQMIKTTHQKSPQGTLVAYKDNSSCIEGFSGESLDRVDGRYEYRRDQLDIIMKVETHNHPTAIAPDPGAATGVGGEIRDEGATGRGSRSKAGLSAFVVSDLNVPGFRQPWESQADSSLKRLASPLQIMLEGPIGGAAFGNEFGRPQLAGLFRTYQGQHFNRTWGYHKPIMVAGGMGVIKRGQIQKHSLPVGAKVVQLGGPSFRIGIGGGAASSMATGENAEDLDYNSVQRSNPEMQRRCQEVIDACVALNDMNPILSIHDVGAGGLSNACPELVEAVGATFNLREVHCEDASLSPMEIWCNESQERYMLAVSVDGIETFEALCRRERCPYAIIGSVSGDGRLTVQDPLFASDVVDMPLEFLLGNPPKMTRDVKREVRQDAPFNCLLGLDEAIERVLRVPAVARKTFLITIADRTVTGLVARDQMVGPYQVPVSDVAVTTTGFTSTTGEAMAMGERTPIAVVDAPASARMAVGESLLNICAALVVSLGQVKLSANWMVACGEQGQDADLWDTCHAVAKELCPALGISIPVGKDSVSMKTVWSENGIEHRVVAPLSLIVSAFAPVVDVRKTLTPQLVKDSTTELLLLDLGQGKNRLGCSVLAQVCSSIGGDCPDVDDPEALKNVFNAIQELNRSGLVLAYHDRSDGGLAVTLIEMAIAGRCGVSCKLSCGSEDALRALFSEELGAVLQFRAEHKEQVHSVLDRYQVTHLASTIGTVTEDASLSIECSDGHIYKRHVRDLDRIWSELTFHMQSLRDNPEQVSQEFDALLDIEDPGLQARLTFDPENFGATFVGARPKVAILREQGVNGHVEMAAAFEAAGFEPLDYHMSDLVLGTKSLSDCRGLVACGGFSFGDVLGAGTGWAQAIMKSARLREQFEAFFQSSHTFSLGVCNGCQMMAQLKGIIPGAELWPRFVRNVSEQFEARLVSVEVVESPSVLLKGMTSSILPIPVAHGEGLVLGDVNEVESQGLVSLRFVDNRGNPAETYPANPNGSPYGVTGFTSKDGRATIMMPHPERAFRSLQLSYNPGRVFDDAGPWLRMFQNARAFVG